MALLTRARAVDAPGGSPHRNLTRDHAQDLKLFRTRGAKIGLALLLIGYLMLPTVVQNDFWLSVLVYSGITAIGAIGLNLLTGYCGQVSLGHAFFVGAGAYSAAVLGGDLGLPLPLWLFGSAVVGAAIGAAIGPFALRLRGLYLAIVTLGWYSSASTCGATSPRSPAATPAAPYRRPSSSAPSILPASRSPARCTRATRAGSGWSGVWCC